jgi:protein gp37
MEALLPLADVPDADRSIPRSVARTMTAIQWADFTGNRWIGCTPVPANSGALSGCDICYACTFGRDRAGVEWGAGKPRRLTKGFAARMRRLDALAAKLGMPFSVFGGSLNDWLDAEVDPAWRAELVDVVESCPNLTWLMLTHRPQLAAKLLPGAWRSAPPANLWAGVTVDHRLHARRWDQHAEFWAHTGRAWVSAEPLASSLAGIALDGAATVVVGGASNTRDPAWAFDTRWVDEALAQWGEERVFFKQYGVFKDGVYVGDKKLAGRDLEGRVYDRTAWPRHREALAAAA